MRLKNRMVISTSYILLRGVCFHAFIGVGEQERCVGNDFILDLRIGYSLANAMKSDDVMDTLNYAEVYDLIKNVMQHPMKLLEAAAGCIVDNLTATYKGIESIDLKLIKLNPPMGADCEGAGVELHLINK